MSTSQVPEPRTGARRIIVVLAALTAVAPLATDMYVPAFPEMAESLTTTETAVQVSMTAFLLGLAIGQVVLGPLSDRSGRRVVLLSGALAFAVCSLACAIAPTIEVFVAARFVQGVAGAAGVVVARAVVTDRFDAAGAARQFAALSAIVFVAPVAAPVLGGAVLGVAPWRVVFVTLALFGVLLIAGVLAWVPESLPAARRAPGGVAAQLAAMRRLLTAPAFVVHLLVLACASAALFAYISASTFVFQDVHGLSATAFSLVFASNATAMLIAGLTFGRLSARSGVARLLVAGLVLAVVAVAALVVAGAVGAAGLAVTWGCLLVLAFGLGLSLPAVMTRVQEFGRGAPGASSGLFGGVQFLFGALAAPLVGAVSGTSGSLPMATVLLVCLVLAVVAAVPASRCTVPEAAPATAVAGNDARSR